MKKHASGLTIAAAIIMALAVLTASAAADTTITMDIPVTAQSTYIPAPQDIFIPDNAAKLTVSADTTDLSIDIHLYDPSERHTGAIYPRGEETAIPGSTYSGYYSNPEIITVVSPASGNYTLKAYGYYTTGWANVTATISGGSGGLSHLSGRVMGCMLNGTFIPLKDVTIDVTYFINGTLYRTFLNATDEQGDFRIDVPPYIEVDLKFNKTGFYECSEEGVRTLGPCETKDLGTTYLTEKPRIRYGSLIVDVMDRATGKNVGTFSVPDTEGGGPWPVPEVNVTAWDRMTKDFITSNETKNGTATLLIPILPGADSRIVDVNNTPVREWSDNTTAYPGVTEGSEMRVTAVVDKSKFVWLYVGVIKPPPPEEKYLKLSVTPDTVKIYGDTEVTATVTDKYTEEAIESAAVTLSGCGVSENGHTGADGKVSFTIHPTAPGQITVTANKTGYNEGVTTMTSWHSREFDTGKGDYPSIMGTHNGTITPAHKVIANKLYTYPCPGTGGHSEYVRIWNSLWSICGTWEGYRGDWHNISFSDTFVLEPGETYNYEIRTGSYPQIIHQHNLTTADGMITCAEFVDANGKSYNDWIPALRLFFVPSPEKAHIKGKVMERLPDWTLNPLGDVDVTATYSANMTACGRTITGSDGYFTIDVPPYSVIDLQFTKAGYHSRCEEGIDLTDYGPCETYDMATTFMSKMEPPPEYCVNITAEPMSHSVCSDEDATYTLTICNCADVSDTIVLGITAGPGSLSKGTFSLDAGECDVAELTVSSFIPGTFDTTVRATSRGDATVLEEVTVMTTVMGANLAISVRDYVTGNLVGTFNKTNTTAGTECRVPELLVEVKGITGELIKGKLTTNGMAEFYIPSTTYPKVNVFANGNRSLDWYMPNVDKSRYYVPWIEHSAEFGVTISTVPTIASVYVGVKEPPVHYLTVNAITSGRDKKIIVNTTEEVTADVTGSYSYDGRTVTENIPHVTVSLTGAGVFVPDQTTDATGIATFGAVTPTTVENITVTATKPLCFVDSDPDTIKVYDSEGCPVIEVRPVDVEHADIKIAPSTVGVTAGVALYNQEGTMVTKPIDVGVIWDNGPGDSNPEEGVILIDTGHIDLAQAKGRGPFCLLVTSDPQRYSYYLEHSIDLSAQLDCEAPMKMITTPSWVEI